MQLSNLQRYGIVTGTFVGLYSFLLYLGYWSVLLLATCSLGAIAAIYTHRETVKRRIKWELESAEAQWQLQHQKNGPGVVLESFTLGWLNLFIQSLWSPVLEKHIAGLTGDLLQRVLNEVRMKNSHKSPWKYLDSILLEELRFGAVPPTFQNALAKYDPEASLLTITMDVRFNSNSAQAVMLLRTKVLPIVSTAFNVRLEATYVQFSGRLVLGFLLGPQAPGIEGIYYSFASRPSLDLAVQPLGLPLPPELLALTGALQGVLQRIISRRMVEPQRRFFDLHRMYTNRHIARVGGPGGLLQMVVQRARNLSAAASSAAAQSKSDSLSSTAQGMTAAAAAAASTATGILSRMQQQQQAKKSNLSTSSKRPTKMATFCQVKLGKQVLRTPVAHHEVGADAVWNWQLSLALPVDLATAAAAAVKDGGGGDGVCVIAVYEAQTVGDPLLLGKCKVTLSSLKLVPNSEPLALTLPLSGTPAAAKSNMQMSLAWLKSTRPAQQRQRWQPQSERVLQQVVQDQQQQHQQQQQQQQQHNRSQSQQSVASLGGQVQQQLPVSQGHSRSVSAQSVSSLGLFSPGVVSAGSSASGITTTAAAAADPDQVTLSGIKELRLPTVQTNTTLPQPLFWNSQQQQQHSASASIHIKGRISRSADSSPVQDTPPAATQQQQQQQQQGQSLPTKVPHRAPRRSVTVDLAAAAAAAAASTAARSGLPTSTAMTSKTPALSGYRGTSVSQAVSRDAQTAGATAGGTDADSNAAFNGPAAGSSSSTAAGSTSNVSTPLAMLASVVQLQKQVELQQQQLVAMQQQLASVSTSYEELQRQCRQDALSALLQGARFMLRSSSDGSLLPVLLYLTSEQLMTAANGASYMLKYTSQLSSAGSSKSSRGSSFTSSSSSMQQPQQQQGLHVAGTNSQEQLLLSLDREQQLEDADGLQYCLVIAALPGDNKNWKAAAKRRIAAVMSHRGSGKPSRVNGADFKQNKQQGVVSSQSAGAYEAEVVPRQDLPLIAVIPVDQLQHVQAAGQESDEHSFTGLVIEGNGRQQAVETLKLVPESRGEQQGIVLHFSPQSAADSVQGEQQATSSYELIIPAVGNGRSRDEWVFALQHCRNP